MPRKSTATKNIDMIVGRNVRIFRIAKHVTQTELAKHIGVTFQQVQKYELGVNRIGSGRLMQIAIFLRRPIMDFFAGVEGTVDKADSSVLGFMAERHSVRLVQAFADIADPGLRRALVNLVEDVASSKGTYRT